MPCISKEMQTLYETGVEDGRNDLAAFLLSLQKDNPEMPAESLVQSAFAFNEAMRAAKENGE